MVKCFECGKEEPLTFKCHFCGERFCSDHRLPESHNCLIFENELKKHEKAWKKGAASIKYNDDYGKNYDLRSKNNYYNSNKYNSSSKKDYDYEDNKYVNTNYGKYTCPTCGKRFSHTNVECSKCWKYFCSKECAMNHGCHNKNKKESNSNKKYWNKKTSFNLQKVKSILPIIFILLIIVLFFMAIEFNRTQQEFQNRILIEDVEIEVALFNEQIEKILTKIDYNGEETIEKIYIKKDNVILKEFDCTFNCSERIWLDVSNEKKFSKSDNNISEFLIEKTEIELCAKNSDLEKCYNYIIPVNQIINFNNCEDGTIHDKCSINKPLFCSDGNLSEKASVCGCPIDFRKEKEQCIEIKRCSDKTEYGECSNIKPYFCENGELIEKANVCGCPIGPNFEKSGDKCFDLKKPDLEYIEKRIHELINIERATNGLSKLSFDYKLADIARKHSEDMAINNFFSHTNLIGQSPSDRAERVGYNCRKNYGSYYTSGIAENIHQGWTHGTIYYTNGIETSRNWYNSDKIAENAVTGWMNSPGHRKNILTSTYDKEGIGAAITSEGKVYLTQNFC